MASGLVGSSGQQACRRSLVLVSRFESSLRPWPPSAPTSPLASVPWQHLGEGGWRSRNKGLCLPSCLSLWALPDSTVHTWAPTGPLLSGPLTNPRTTRLLVLGPTNMVPNTSPQGASLNTSQRTPVTPACWLQLTLMSAGQMRPGDEHRVQMDTSCPLCPALGFVHVGPLESQTRHCLRGQKRGAGRRGFQG